MTKHTIPLNKASIACLMRALILQQDGSITSFAHRAGLPQPSKKNRHQASSKPVRRQPAARQVSAKTPRKTVKEAQPGGPGKFEIK